MSKRKGSVGERELVHLFWSTPDWIAARIAGSGSMRYPAPDLIAGNDKRKIVVEAKASKSTRIYIPKEEVEALLVFATKFRAEAWIAYRFDRQGWKFVTPSKITLTEKNYVVNNTTPGMSFEELTSFL